MQPEIMSSSDEAQQDNAVGSSYATRRKVIFAAWQETTRFVSFVVKPIRAAMLSYVQKYISSK